MRVKRWRCCDEWEIASSNGKTWAEQMSSPNQVESLFMTYNLLTDWTMIDQRNKKRKYAKQDEIADLTMGTMIDSDCYESFAL